MNEKIESLACMTRNILELIQDDKSVLSVTVNYAPDFKTMQARVHVMEELPGMGEAVPFCHNLLKRSVDVSGVEFFCLSEEGGSHD